MTRSASSSAADLSLRARAELERRRRGETNSTFTPYRFDPKRYIADKLGWTPWSGDDAQPGQTQVLDAYALALTQLHEKRDFENTQIGRADLTSWEPGQVIQNRIRVPAGHTVGKTKLASGIVNHFFDCFAPSIIYTFAPSWPQIKDLLWKEIKADRSGTGLPGEILDLELRRGPDHFAKGRATSDAHGRGTERIQGQHGQYLMFVIDEAEGVADYVFNAIDSMASGGIAIVLMLANPRTRFSRFHKAARLATVTTLRISCLWHPNVLAGREVVPGAVQREYVEQMIDAHCEVVEQHDDDAYTFTLPFPVRANGTIAPAEQLLAPGTIYRPDPEFMFRILGIAPANVADNTLVPSGRYEAATHRAASGDNPHQARMGVDAARWGQDYGTLYVEHAGRVWRAAQLWQLDNVEYYQRVKQEALALPACVTSLHIRVDGGGGFGGGVIDLLRRDVQLRERFADFIVYEVNFNGTPHDEKAYHDLATEMYDLAGQRLKALRLDHMPELLETDVCERTYEWVIREGQSVKKLTAKDKFKKAQGHSPDDGDGWALCTAPDFLFKAEQATGKTIEKLWKRR
jgi:hypothetical protein